MEGPPDLVGELRAGFQALGEQLGAALRPPGQLPPHALPPGGMPPMGGHQWRMGPPRWPQHGGMAPAAPHGQVMGAQGSCMDAPGMGGPGMGGMGMYGPGMGAPSMGGMGMGGPGGGHGAMRWF